MATITSPRISNHPPSPTSSVRSSISVDRASAANQPPARRNRSALRDFYNLQPAPPRSAATSHTPSVTSASAATSRSSTPVPDPADPSEDAELDRPDFAPQQHVDALLAAAGLGDMLRAEARLLSEIRGLDGERKALVYDNYSKLIAATDTIGRMRRDMDKEGVGLEGVGAKLEGLVGGIVHKAEGVAVTGKAGDAEAVAQRRRHAEGEAEALKKRNTVRWALQTPERLRESLRDGRRADAEQDWKEIQALLDKWKDVGGVAELRAQCEEAMRSDEPPVQDEDD